MHENLSRVDNLLRLHQEVHGSKPGKTPSDGDILRSAVVFIHAALEDFLRGLSIVYLPDSSPAALDKIPLLGFELHRPKNFGLGALLIHKHKTVARLIEQSVLAHLRRSTYSNIPEIDSLLSDCGKQRWPEIEKSYPSLSKLMERRHRIVHRSDSTDNRQKGHQRAAAISHQEVSLWAGAVRAFAAEITKGIINDERAAARKEGYIAFLKTLNQRELEMEIDQPVADHSDRIINSEEASGAMAETNATGFYIDDYHIVEIAIDDDAKECRVSLTWHASGDSDPEKPFFGDEISGTAVAIIDDEGSIHFHDVTASRVDDSEWDDWPPE